MGDIFDRSSEPDQPPSDEPPPPAWQSPPRGMLPGVIGSEFVLAQSDYAAVFLAALACYPTGIEFEVRVLAAQGTDLEPSLDGYRRTRGGQPREAFDQMLRFGIQYADGRQVSNVRGSLPDGVDPDGVPLGPRLVLRSVTGMGGRSWRSSFWLWPLPPPGELSFICEWPPAGINRTRKHLDADMVIRAAARAQQIFNS